VDGYVEEKKRFCWNI